MKRIIITCTVCLSCLLLGSAITAYGQIYKWVDAEGQVHYSDTPIDEAENIDEELPPASRFISPPRPPATSSEEAQPQQEDSAGSADESAEASTDDESSQEGQPQEGQQQEEVIGLGDDGPFGPDGPDAPVQNSE